MLDILSTSFSLSLYDVASCVINRPEGLLPDHLANYMSSLERIIYNTVQYWVRSDKMFEAVVDADYFQVLPKETQRAIKDCIYEWKISRVPRVFSGEADAHEFIENYDLSWMTEDDRGKFKRNAETALALFRNKYKYETLFSALRSVLGGGPCGDDVGAYGDLAEPIRKIETEIAVARRKNSEEAERLEELRSYVEGARTKVDRQLEIIGLALRGDIERLRGLEYPEDLFGQTNIERIKEVITRISSTRPIG